MFPKCAQAHSTSHPQMEAKEERAEHHQPFFCFLTVAAVWPAAAFVTMGSPLGGTRPTHQERKANPPYFKVVLLDTLLQKQEKDTEIEMHHLNLVSHSLFCIFCHLCPPGRHWIFPDDSLLQLPGMMSVTGHDGSVYPCKSASNLNKALTLSCWLSDVKKAGEKVFPRHS